MMRGAIVPCGLERAEEEGEEQIARQEQQEDEEEKDERRRQRLKLARPNRRAWG